LRGARQVGKTTAVNIFSQNFDQFISLNLEIKEDADLFNNELPITKLVPSIYLYKIISKVSGKLLLIDEIRNSPRAVMMLRYFYEKHPAIHVIAAGSLNI
jgi:predicted AAA+ superfamily ATPase